ncbi:MAG TPA: DUF3160 domain-containing protein [Verrucomicrobiae bacterium]|jgi:hypothetical protein
MNGKLLLDSVPAPSKGKYSSAVLKFPTNLFWVFVGLTLCWPAQLCWGQVVLGISNDSSGIHLSVPSTIFDPAVGSIFPEYTIFGSQDLVSWKPIGGKLRGISGASGPLLDVPILNAPNLSFYRAIASTNSPNTQETASGGADVFGYNTLFASQMAQLQSMSIGGFLTNYPLPSYLPQLDWDPTTAQYWTNFNIDPAVWNETHTNYEGQRRTDYRLNSNEFAIFQTNGFVVSERLGNQTFAHVYYQLMSDQMPMFISADSILQAWHRTYDNLLEELEELELATLMEQVINGMAAQLPKVQNLDLFFEPAGPLTQSAQDADFFLAVAKSLWTGQGVSAVLDPRTDNRVSAALGAIQSLTLQEFNLFGTNRLIDFSQFQPRGHYTDSVRLQRYFQTMMWCSLIDLRVATFDPNKENDIRELGTTVILDYLLQQSGQYPAWLALDQALRGFVGVPESMTFPQLESLLSAANIHSPADVTSLDTLTNLQTQLLTGELGVETFSSSVFFYDPFTEDVPKLPRSFAVFSQRFTMDAWAFSQVTYPITGNWNFRMRPSCLDVGFSVFGDNSIAPELASRMMDTNGAPFRDGLPYQTNLAAVRNVIDSQNPGAWTSSMYTAWLGALRALSAPTTDSKYPEVMRTQAWAMKNLNTQMASWTQLKHDTILYDSQAVAGEPILCEYPTGYVEPRPEFWQAMNNLTTLAANAIAALPLSGTITIPSQVDPSTNVQYDLPTIQSAEFNCLTNFAAQMLVVEDMAQKELAQLPFTEDETNLILNFMQQIAFYDGVETYNGWYPALFYHNVYVPANWAVLGNFDETEGSDKWDALVTDVQTDPGTILAPGPINDPGAILEEAVGSANLIMLAVDNGTNRMVYAGPVLSHYEFESPVNTRLTDAQWKTQLQSAEQPPPDWTSSYLVPQ